MQARIWHTKSPQSKYGRRLALYASARTHWN